MQIVCPNCTTSYEVGATTIGATGRSVRCMRCRAIWQASPAEPARAAGIAAPKDLAASDEAVAAFQQELGSGKAETPPPAAPELSPADPSAASLDPPRDIETAAAAASQSDQPVEPAADARPVVPVAKDAVPIADAPGRPRNPSAGARYNRARFAAGSFRRTACAALPECGGRAARRSRPAP